MKPVIIGISLGWNCYAAIYAVANDLRGVKKRGYMTCPFDEMITNFNGVTNCILDDFKYFLDDEFLKVINAPFSTGGIIKNEPLVFNTKYNFIFNHESPGHADLYLSQSWHGGKNHYIDDNFAAFKKRYSERINNFRNYLNEYDEITFIIHGHNTDISKLQTHFKNKKFKYVIVETTDLNLMNEHINLMMRSDDKFKEIL